MKTLQTIIDELKRAGRCYQGINDEEKCVAHGVMKLRQFRHA